MDPCNFSSATNSAVEVSVVSPTTTDTANRLKALTLIESWTKRLPDNGENKATQIPKKQRQSVICYCW